MKEYHCWRCKGIMDTRPFTSMAYPECVTPGCPEQTYFRKPASVGYFPVKKEPAR